MAIVKLPKLKISVLMSFVLLSAFIELGRHELKLVKFQMNIENIEKDHLTVKIILHWNKFPLRLCNPCHWRPS